MAAGSAVRDVRTAICIIWMLSGTGTAERSIGRRPDSGTLFPRTGMEEVASGDRHYQSFFGGRRTLQDENLSLWESKVTKGSDSDGG